jgi:GGDEF domain-containing protein
MIASPDLLAQPAAVATVSAVGTMVLLAAGLPRDPSRSVRIWAAAFAIGMLGSFAQVAGMVSDIPAVYRGGWGLVLAIPTFAWAGFRTRDRASAGIWVAIAHCVVSTALAALVAEDHWEFVGRALLVVGAASAFSVAFACVRSDVRSRMTPLTVSSVTLALACLFAAAPNLSGAGSGIVAGTKVIEIGLIAFLMTGLVVLMGLIDAATGQSGVGRSDGWALFRSIATDRLARAEANEDRRWAVILIDLDDRDTIEFVGGRATVDQASARLEGDVRAAFPADVDIGVQATGRVVVLTARSDSRTRDALRRALRAISDGHSSSPFHVPASASVGWAPVSVAGFDLDTLLAEAERAAASASADGGDRWMRLDSDAN